MGFWGRPEVGRCLIVLHSVLTVTLENDFKISALYAMSFFGSISDSRDTIDFSVIKQVHTSNLDTNFCNPSCPFLPTPGSTAEISDQSTLSLIFGDINLLLCKN